ncbi:SIMPL domain-containing protein [Stakelama sp. CBK3Z-3]|uniref:SIMPL domain-containing protein n=1 Tax=Stakelama flava TaxID=2860338 RepID=A0ABS6XIP7_9SPHN|nr:SIMPL domain-containing protein [Stakelama flava]MBW4330062.1 SIMPL domain-containing protein [Stakelama flava]
MRNILITAGAAAALAAIAPAMPACAQELTTPVPLPAGATILDISAQGSVTRTPDIATIRAGVVTEANDAAGALSANATRMNAVLAALKKAGIAERDIQTAAISLNPKYQHDDDQPPRITGYQATNTVTIRFRDIKRSGAILDALVGEGANQIQGPDLSVDDMEAAQDEARSDAVKKARARAELYARAAGLSVDRIVWIRESGVVSAPRPVMAMRTMAVSDSTQIRPGEQDVSINVDVRFLLK